MPEPKHILFLIDSYFGTGGAEGVLVRIARHLPKDRYRCSVITYRGLSQQEARADFDCPYDVYPLDRLYDINAFRQAFRLASFIRRERVDLVHTFFEASDIWGAPVAKLAGVKRVISSRRDMGILRKKRHKLLYRLLAPIYDQVQTVSNEVAKYMISADSLDPRRVVTVYNGIEAGRFGDAVEPASLAGLGLGHATGVIVSVGNIREVKGFDVLLEAAAIVTREFPGAMFAIVGGTNVQACKDQLEEQAKRLGITENVRFLGKWRDVAPILRASTVFCLPSRSEGLSNALLEAMASGLPVVATRVGGNAEVVRENETGFLIASEDPQAMAEHMLKLLRDPDRARQMGRAGREVVLQSFSVEAMIARMVACYEGLLG